MHEQTLVILDYSGTLSLEAPRFGHADHLEAELAESGLAALGIRNARLFWDEIVNPTWEEGSTTSIGYAALMADRIRQWQIANVRAVADGSMIQGAAALFVRRYLAHSVIDSRWEPVLKALEQAPAVRTVIATDHYAEATDAILTHLRDMNLAGMALRELQAENAETAIVVANSADLGFHKSDRRFWEAIGTRVPAEELRRALIVDDFGTNEQAADAYGAPARVAERRRRTLEMLQEVFRVSAEAIDFYAQEATAADTGSLDALFRRTTCTIEAYLERSHELPQRRPGQ